MDVEQTVMRRPRTASQYVLNRASLLVRRGPLTTKTSSLVPVKKALDLIGVLCQNLETDILMPSLQTILLPLHNLTDASIPAPSSIDETFNSSYQSLKSDSAEIMSTIQKKVGTTEYIAALGKVRLLTKERREGRRVKRRIEAVAAPENLGKVKKRKGERKRDKRKERSAGERGKRRGW